MTPPSPQNTHTHTHTHTQISKKSYISWRKNLEKDSHLSKIFSQIFFDFGQKKKCLILCDFSKKKKKKKKKTSQNEKSGSVGPVKQGFLFSWPNTKIAQTRIWHTLYLQLWFTEPCTMASLAWPRFGHSSAHHNAKICCKTYKVRHVVCAISVISLSYLPL